MSKKKTQFRHRCIFCGGYAISNEHIWPAWLKKHLPHIFKRHPMTKHITTLWHGDTYNTKTTQRPGPPRTHKLKVTCRKCNNEWISHIDNKVKDIFLRLVDGQWDSLNQDDRIHLAAWATRFTMVYEFAHKETVSVPQEERDYFYRKHTPPEGWFIFLGYYIGSSWVDKWNHRALTLIEDSDSVEIATGIGNKTQISPRRAQSTVLILGKMALNIVSGLDLDPARYSEIGLRIVWPDSYPLFFSPPLLLGDDAINTIAGCFGGAPFTH